MAGVGMAAGVAVRARLSLVMARGGVAEAWTLGTGGEAPERVLASGPAQPAFSIEPGGWCLVPEGVRDEEALLLPMAGQVLEAVVQARVGLGDPLLVLGDGLRRRLAGAAAARRGAVVAAAGETPRDRLGAALVVEAGRGFEAAACRAVRGGGTVVLATGPGNAGDFDFYRLLQQTGVRLVGVEARCRFPEAGRFGEALRMARACLETAGAFPVMMPGGLPADGEYLVRWGS